MSPPPVPHSTSSVPRILHPLRETVTMKSLHEVVWKPPAGVCLGLGLHASVGTKALPTSFSSESKVLSDPPSSHLAGLFSDCLRLSAFSRALCSVWNAQAYLKESKSHQLVYISLSSESTHIYSLNEFLLMFSRYEALS